MPDGRPAVRMSAELGEEVARWIDEGREGEALVLLRRARERWNVVKEER